MKLIEATFTNSEALAKFDKEMNIEKKIINFQELKSWQQNEIVLQVLKKYKYSFSYFNPELFEITFTNIPVNKFKRTPADCIGRTLTTLKDGEISKFARQLYDFKYFIEFNSNSNETIAKYID
jgi:hypothetical protein